MDPSPTSSEDYKRRAEARIRERRIRKKVNVPANLTREEFERLLYDLEVHQIELEMQNEELRASQSVIEASRHEYSDLYDFSPIGYFSINRDGAILRANLTGAGQLGVERSLLMNRPFSLYVARQDRDLFREHLRAVFTTRTPQRCELRMEKRRSGGSKAARAARAEREVEPFDVRIESIVVERAGFGPSCRAAVTDITVGKRAEEALRESEERYRSLVEGVKDYAIVLLDAGGRIASWNAGAEQIHGYSSEEILGRPVSALCADDESLEPLLVAAEREPTAGNQGWFLRKGGSRFWGDLTVTALWDRSGRLSGFSMINRDLTDRKRAEEEILKVSKLESIGVLAGGIAHDFNNILMGISGYLHLAKSSSDPTSPWLGALTEAERACMRATRLTQQLLTFSRGGAPIKRRINIGALLEDWAGFGLRGSNVHCEFSLPNDLWPVEADEGQMSQVINNLVINAQQAMPTGGTIRISGENLKAGPSALPGRGRVVRISVKDEGVGISEENLSRIFDPFFTTKSTGSGLGLTTSYAIVQKHGGALTVASDGPGQGTTFFIDLPAAAQSVGAATSEEPAMPPRGKGGRVLFMDDDEALRSLIGELLPTLGYEVECVREGAEAVECYREALEKGRRFDAVILDLTVAGGMGGTEAVERLRAIDPEARMAVSSGYSQDAVLANFRHYGFSATLVKPFQIEDLQRVLLHLTTPPS